MGRDGPDPQSTARHAIVLAGGDAPPPSVLAGLLPAGLVVAADSGLHLAHPLGLRADVVVGDLDSVDHALLARAEAAGTEVVRHPAAKDATDLELALRLAIERGARRISVLGIGGGRLDHLLAGLLALAAPELAGARVEGFTADTRLLVVHDHAALHDRPGQLLTLVPVGGPARGVSATGVRYSLRGEDLAPGTTRGVSNEFAAPVVTLDVREGVLLALRPQPVVPAAPAGAGDASPSAGKVLA